MQTMFSRLDKANQLLLMFEFWWLRIAIKVKTIAVTYRSRKHVWVWYTCLSALDTQIMVYSWQTHFSAFTLFPHTFRIMFWFVLFSQCAQMYQLYDLLISFVSWVSFWGLSWIFPWNLSWNKLAENTVLWESPFNLLVYFAGYSK